MQIVIDANDRRPIYRQVADEIKALIARKELAGGETLPSVRQLAADLGVNLNTIAAAYRELQDEGLIAIRHGSGAVVASRRAPGSTATDLRRPLAAALTEMVLAGMRRGEIMRLVADELRMLIQGAKK